MEEKSGDEERVGKMGLCSLPGRQHFTRQRALFPHPQTPGSPSKSALPRPPLSPNIRRQT